MDERKMDMQPSWLYSAVSRANSEDTVKRGGRPYSFLTTNGSKQIVTRYGMLYIGTDALELSDRERWALTEENQVGNGLRMWAVRNRVR